MHTDDPKRASAAAEQRLSEPKDVLPGEWSQHAASHYMALADMESPQCPDVYFRARQRAEASLGGGGVSGWNFRLLDNNPDRNLSRRLPVLPESKQRELKERCEGTEKIWLVLGLRGRRKGNRLEERSQKLREWRKSNRAWNQIWDWGTWGRW